MVQKKFVRCLFIFKRLSGDFRVRLQPNFLGYQDFVARRTQRPEGRDGKPLPVAELPDECWELAPRYEQKGKGLKVLFPGDNSAAYFRYKCETAISVDDRIEISQLYGIPVREHHLRDVGAYRLSRLLGLDIIPKTELAELNLPFGNVFEKVVGSIQHWVKGRRLLELGYNPNSAAWKKVVDDNERRLFDHYVYTVVAYDMDREERNFCVRESDGSVWAYDVNLSGGDPANMPLRFPYGFTYKIVDRPLPPGLVKKLKKFVANKKAAKKELETYYPTESVKKMFHRAQYLLDHPVVVSVYQLRKHLT